MQRPEIVSKNVRLLRSRFGFDDLYLERFDAFGIIQARKMRPWRIMILADLYL